jgi:hypothetical protein
MSTITADDIRRVRRRLADCDNWTVCAWARDRDGAELDHGWEPGAVCWCLIGAAEAEGVCRSDELVPGREVEASPSYAAFALTLGFDSVRSCWYWQDNALHSEVMSRLDETIERMEAAA